MFFNIHKQLKRPQPPLESRLVKKLYLVLVQCAAFLQQQASRLSFRRLRFLLFLFCLFSGCICGWIIVSSLRQKEADEPKVTPIRLTVQVMKTGNKNLDTDHLTENKWQQVQAWRHAQDSLRRRALYDRYRSSKRGQLDSLHQIENGNNIQQRTKGK